MRKFKNTLAALGLIYTLVISGCGASNFATDLRLALAVSAPFIESLQLGGRKATVVAAFTELGSDAATMADIIKGCAGNKGCELGAVQVFEGAFEAIANRDFQNIPKLAQVESLIRGILAAAKIYYGARPPAGMHPNAQSDPLKEIKTKTAQLKALTHQ